MTYADLVLSLSPLAYYTFDADEPSTYPKTSVLHDSSGNGRDGVVSAGTSQIPGRGNFSIAPPIVATNEGGASGYFEGSTAGIANAGWFTGPLSINMWMRTAHSDFLVSQAVGANSRFQLQFIYDEDDEEHPSTIYLGFFANGAFRDFTIPLDLPLQLTDGDRHMVSVAISSTVAKLWIDGSVAWTTNSLGGFVAQANPGPVKIGSGVALDPGGERMPGSYYDEIAFFGTALSDSDIADLYTAGQNGDDWSLERTQETSQRASVTSMARPLTVFVAGSTAGSDLLEEATPFTGLPFTSSQTDNTNFTETETEDGVRTAWWTWTPDQDCEITVDTLLTDLAPDGEGSPDTVLTVWRETEPGSGAESITQVAFNDDAPSGDIRSEVSLSVVAGTSYYFCVGVFGTPNNLNYVLRVALADDDGGGGGPGDAPYEDTKTFGAGGTLSISGDGVTTTPTLGLMVLTPVLNQAPGSIDVTVAGGDPLATVTFKLDGDTLVSGVLNSDGSLSLSLAVDAAHGAMGEHTVTVAQLAMTGDTATGEATFTISMDPPSYPVVPQADVAPALIAQQSFVVRRWVLQDLAPGGLGSWIMPMNPAPDKTTSPFPKKALNSKHTTANSGMFHIYQGQTPPAEWQFGGYFPDQESIEKLLAYGQLNRRMYVIDHHNRAWICVLTNVEVVPRLQQTWMARGDAPVQTDWGSDYTVTAMILDPNPVTPS